VARVECKVNRVRVDTGDHGVLWVQSKLLMNMTVCRRK
jgi:hypothetical protein